MKIGSLRIDIECRDNFTPIMNVVWVINTIMWLLSNVPRETIGGR